jgi:outer membrane protein TolC
MLRSRTFQSCACAFGLTVLPAICHAELDSSPVLSLTGKQGGLVSDEVAARATATSPAAEEKLREVEAARAQLGKAVADYLPRLSASASAYKLSPISSASLGTVVFAPGAPAGPLAADQPLAAAPLSIDILDHSMGASGALNVPLTDYVFRLVQAHEAAKQQLGAAQHALAAARRKAAYDARALYYDWVRAELDAEVARQDLALGKEHLTRIEALAAADSASLADVARVQATVASSELVVVKAENLAVLQRERCRIAMHDDSARVYEIGEDLREAPPGLTRHEDMEALVRKAHQQRPELASLGAQVKAQEQQARVARAQAMPRLDLSGQTTTANPNQRYFPPRDEFKTTWQVGVQLTYSPNDTVTGLKQAAASRARAQQLDAQRRGLLDAVRSEVVEAVLNHRNALVGLDTTARRLSAAEVSYRARHERFLAEKATLVELTESQTELFRARLDAVQAQVAIRVARARLAYATGEGG